MHLQQDPSVLVYYPVLQVQTPGLLITLSYGQLVHEIFEEELRQV